MHAWIEVHIDWGVVQFRERLSAIEGHHGIFNTKSLAYRKLDLSLNERLSLRMLNSNVHVCLDSRHYSLVAKHHKRTKKSRNDSSIASRTHYSAKPPLMRCPKTANSFIQHSQSGIEWRVDVALGLMSPRGAFFGKIRYNNTFLRLSSRKRRKTKIKVRAGWTRWNLKAWMNERRP